MDPNDQAIMSLIQQAPPPPPPLPIPSPPPSTTPSAGGDRLNQTRSSEDSRKDEREEGCAPQLRQTRTLSAPDPTFGYFFNSPPKATLKQPPASNMTRKRTHSTSEKSSTQSVSYKAKKYPQMYIKGEDGHEEVNPDAYLERGFGWVAGGHPTRLHWLEFVDDLQKKSDKEAESDRQPAPEFLKKLDAMYPGWQEEGFSVRTRSRSNSRSRNGSPDSSPVRKHEEETPEPDTPIAHSSCTSSPAESTLQNTPLHSPVPSPNQETDSVSRSPRSESGDGSESPNETPSRVVSSIKVECDDDV